jgi:hypothetical protein
MLIRWVSRGTADLARATVWSAALVIAGVVLSGPLALLLVELVHPQPPWRDAATFAAAYHPVQLLPYVGGFALIGGFVALMVSLHASAPSTMRIRASLALVLTSVFATLIVFNYVLQTTFVPSLVRPLDEGDAPVVAALTMSNPSSLAWALEMWGYGVLGVATWLIAPVFADRGLERWTRSTFVLNGVVSVLGALATAIVPRWALTTAGIASFVAWNAIVLVMAALVIAVNVRRIRGGG